MNNRAMPPSEQTSPDSTTAIAPSGDRYSPSSPSICFNSIGLSSASDTFPVAAPTCCLHCNQYRQHLHLPCEDLLLRARRCCTRRFFFLPVVAAFPVLLPARGESDPDAFNLLHLESKSQTRSFIFFISNPNPKPDPIPEIPDPDAFNLWFCPGESEEGAASVLSFSQSKAINHGIEGSVLEKVREISKLFFNLSLEEKKKYIREEDDIEGYGNDMIISEKQTLDWNDRLYLHVLPKHQRKLQFWPKNPTHFKEVLDEYGSKIELLNEFILKVLARSLNLDENCFLDQYGTTATIVARFNYYPPCSWPNRVFGFKPHTDISAVTFLLQDKDVEGLQMLKDDHWVGVPIIRDALTISIGDQLEVMSNGIFKSPMHRVMINSKNARISMGLFSTPQTENHNGPVDELLTDETPRLYKNATFTAYSFFNDYQHGRRAIDAWKI